MQWADALPRGPRALASLWFGACPFRACCGPATFHTSLLHATPTATLRRALSWGKLLRHAGRMSWAHVAVGCGWLGLVLNVLLVPGWIARIECAALLLWEGLYLVRMLVAHVKLC